MEGIRDSQKELMKATLKSASLLGTTDTMLHCVGLFYNCAPNEGLKAFEQELERISKSVSINSREKADDALNSWLKNSYLPELINRVDTEFLCDNVKLKAMYDNGIKLTTVRMDESSHSNPKSSLDPNFIKGTVVRVTDNEVIVDLGYKLDGVLPRSEFTKDRYVNLSDFVNLGTVLHVYVIQTNIMNKCVLLSLNSCGEETCQEEQKQLKEYLELAEGMFNARTRIEYNNVARRCRALYDYKDISELLKVCESRIRTFEIRQNEEDLLVEKKRYEEQRRIAQKRREEKEKLEEESRREEKRRNEEEQRKKEIKLQSVLWQQQGLCRYCGGNLKGLFFKKCISCGKSR